MQDQGRIEARRAGVHFAAEAAPQSRINYYPPRGDNKEGDNIDIFEWLGYPMQIKVDFLCRDSILAAPIVLDLVLFMDLAQHAGMRGIQEWLSLYFKPPMMAPKLYPEHDLFIRLMKLKNTSGWMMGEDLIRTWDRSITTSAKANPAGTHFHQQEKGARHPRPHPSKKRIQSIIFMVREGDAVALDGPLRFL